MITCCPINVTNRPLLNVLKIITFCPIDITKIPLLITREREGQGTSLDEP